MKSRAAAKERKLLLLAAVCLLPALLLSPTAQASRGLPATSVNLEPPVPRWNADALPAPRHDLFHLEDELLLEILTGVEPDDHQALLEHRRIELLSPSSWNSAIQKTASGVSTSRLELNVQKGKPLKQDLRWTVPFYAKARFYDPEVGRFLTEDPAEPDLTTPPSLHKYLYAYGNPTRYWDPYGLQSADVNGDDEESKRPFFNRFFDALFKPFRSNDKGEAQSDDDDDEEPSWLERHFRIDVVKEAEDNLGSTLSRSRERRARRLEITDENLKSVNESGSFQSGIGNNSVVIKDVVVAGSVTTLIIVDDIGLATGAGGLARHGLKEGAEFVVKKFSDDALHLYKVVDGKAARQSLDEASERSIRKHFDDGTVPKPLQGDDLSRLPGEGFSRGDSLGEIRLLDQRMRARFEGVEVRSVRGLSHIDESTLRAMREKGFAATDLHGNKIELHHLEQNPHGPIVEIPFKHHWLRNKSQHPRGNQPGAGLTSDQRALFDVWRERYWRARATSELAARGLL